MKIQFRPASKNRGFDPHPNIPMPLLISEFYGGDIPGDAAILLDTNAYLGWSIDQSNNETGTLILFLVQKFLDRDWAALRAFRFIMGVNTGTIGRRLIPLDVRADVLSAGRCALCGSTERLSVDHIRPLSKGGSDDRENLQCLCLPCNLRKGAQ